jgi:hypothetical protein
MSDFQLRSNCGQQIREEDPGPVGCQEMVDMHHELEIHPLSDWFADSHNWGKIFI